MLLEIQSKKYVRRARQISAELPAIIPQWHQYAYDGPVFNLDYAINDGGSDMYDRGNKVSTKIVSSHLCVNRS